LDNHSETKVMEGKKPVIKLDDVQKFQYDLPKIPVSVKEKGSAIKYRDTFKMALRYLGNLNKRKKLLFVVMFLAAILVVSGFVKLYSSTKIDEVDFLKENRNLVEVKGVKNYDYDDYLTLEGKLGDASILPLVNSQVFSELSFDLFAQNRFAKVEFPQAAILPLSLLDNPTIYKGQMPTKADEIIIDKWVADIILEDYFFKRSGGLFYEQIIGQSYYRGYNQLGGKIVGIINTNNPTIYVSDELYYTNALKDNLPHDSAVHRYETLSLSAIDEYYDIADFDNEILTDNAVVAQPKAIPANWQQTKQILVSKEFYRNYLYNTLDNTRLLMPNGEKYTVIGLVDVGFEQNIYLHSSNLCELSLVLSSSTDSVIVYSLNKKATIKILEDEKLRARDRYQLSYEEYYEGVFDIFQYIFSIIILASSLIFLYFIMRSSLIARVYEIGVYRALGVRKSNVYRLFVSEIVLITLFSSLIGVIVASIFIVQVNKIAGMVLIEYPWFVGVASIIFLFICNLLIGLSPVIHLLRSTPSQILSKYDI
ncbi:MAG TPA: FtsX-like permease family protein, partial [Bacilli bacterium]|nr:FtsX-like permease family protein [Bacilli bacterium]